MSSESTIIVTDALKKAGITEVVRGGTKRTGFYITFKLKDKDLILYPKSKRDKTQAELEKILKRFSGNKRRREELSFALEAFIVENFDWMNGRSTSFSDYVDDSHNTNDFNEETNSNGNPFDKYLDKNPSDPLDEYREVSIVEAAQLHEGKIKFTGRINTISPDIKGLTVRSVWICRGCGNDLDILFKNILNPPNAPKKCMCGNETGFDHEPELMNYRLLKIESDNIAMQRSPIFVRIYALDKYAAEVDISSRLTVYGEVVNHVDMRTKQSSTFILAKRIVYHDRQVVQLQPEDIPRILELSKSHDLPAALVSFFATHLKDFEFEKFLVILAAIGGPTIRNPNTKAIIQRGPLNILFIGLPGCGKSAIAGESVYLVLRSKDIHGEYTTKATLCGTVVQDEGKLVIKPGVAVLASGAILHLDEIDKAKKDILDGLLEMTEKCTITIAIYGEHIKFDADVALIATSNPRSENWGNNSKLKLADIPLSNRITSRFDLVIPIRELMSEEAWKAYADFIANRTSESMLVDYDLLMKYIEYARRISSVRFNPEAQEIINKFAAKCAMNKDLAYITSKRVIHTIHRIAGAFARLHLSDEITVTIANEAITFIKQIIARTNLDKRSFEPSGYDPLEDIIQSIIKNAPREERAIDLTNHIELLCGKNVKIDAAIGHQDRLDIRFKRRSNRTLDTLCDKIVNDNRICVTGSNREKVYAISESNKDSPDVESRDGCDACDTPTLLENKKNSDFSLYTNSVEKFFNEASKTLVTSEDDTDVEQLADNELSEALDAE
jgi:DNA replicative helicase MCM subunit Mcm2 (Cdc46/Mcm family)